ncbi:hypothetical protein FA13DRAFT_1004397 [Coprinellus micaceus]|uniref:C3H1-type domain-containing protein n=1 Tax=Coprinellus micaceus TaxID=71717 RepID=A0A4Y7RS43_COPMI|nr:hypothetical protein FA13DRAFT_1004397 [Coprinellus micaceus]
MEGKCPISNKYSDFRLHFVPRVNCISLWVAEVIARVPGSQFLAQFIWFAQSPSRPRPHSPTMPAVDAHGDQDRERTRERNDHDRGDKAKKTSNANTKSKDLSHVPCKFFKVGGCTAGSSCPFSHNLPEPGQKESCAWFVKGNCKFGHKCALAHVLPGQDMSMDRKNKKAAQQASAAAGGGGGGGGGGKDRGKGPKREGGPADRGHSGKNPLLAGGSTAPRGSASTAGRPPMNFPSKSAPAPPLNDTDFAALDDMEGVAKPDDDDEQQQQQQQQSETPKSHSDQQALPVSAPRNAAPTSAPQNDFGPIGSPSKAGGTFSPGTSPRLNGASPAISSSPFSAPGNQASFYGPSSYSLTGGVAASLGSGLAMMGGRKGWGSDAYEGTSPSNAFTSNLSASHQHRSSGLSASVTHDVDGGFEYLGGTRNLRKIPRTSEQAVVDEEMEDFIPGSLTDLLTPEERSRRMSRSNSQQQHGLSALASQLKGGEGVDLTAGGAGNGGMMMGHRHSRSVPATSLLGDLKSIWSDPSGANGLPASPSNHHRGTPSTSGLSARFEGLGLGSQTLGTPGDDAALSMSFGSPSSLSMMSPSNASAAFLPGFHQTYMASKAKQTAAGQPSGLGRGLRSTSGSSGLYPPVTANGANGTGPTSSLANNYLSPLDSRGIPASMNTASTLHTHIHGNTSHTYRTTPSPFDLTQSMTRPRGAGLGSNGLGGVGINNPNATLGSELADDPLAMPGVLSPSTRALQSHAPGQSLPQGLAAGLSRIHALPLTNIVSPGTPSSSALGNGGFGVGSIGGGMGVGSVGDRYHLSESYSNNNPLSSNAAGGYNDWANTPSSLSQQQQQYHLGANTLMSSSPLVKSSLPPRNDTHAHTNGFVVPSAMAPGREREMGGAGYGGAPPGLPELPSGKLSYSAAASRAGNAPPMAPPGISKPGYQQPAPAPRKASAD